MASYSHSRLSTFEQCRYKYKLNYIDRVEVETPTTVEAFMGGKVHETLEKLYKDLKFQKLNTLKELLEFYNKIWEKEWTDDILIVKKEYTKENYRKMGEKFITDYYNHYKPFDQMNIIGLETQDKMKLPDGSSYHVRIDKLGFKGTTYYVCDYKTNSWMKDQEEADSDRQLAMYSIWVKDKFKDAKKVVLLWHMLAFGKEVTSERTPAELKQLQKETVALIKEIEKCREFPTHVTNLCNYCVYKSICPAFKHEFKIEELPPKEFKKDDGVKLVDSYSDLKAKEKEIADKLEEIKTNLILFAKQQGLTIVYGSNQKASVKEGFKIILPEETKEKLIVLLKKKGLYEEFSMLNSSGLKASVLKEELTDKDIVKLTKKEKDYRIYVSNRKEEE